MVIEKRTHVSSSTSSSLYVYNDSLLPQICGLVPPYSVPRKKPSNKNTSVGPPKIRSDRAPPILRDVAEVAAGDLHSVARTYSGDVLTWGFGDSGALGRILDSKVSKVVKVVKV